MPNSTTMERNALLKLYGPQWEDKVKKMSDRQVIAVYLSFKSKGKIK